MASDYNNKPNLDWNAKDRTAESFGRAFKLQKEFSVLQEKFLSKMNMKEQDETRASSYNSAEDYLASTTAKDTLKTELKELFDGALDEWGNSERAARKRLTHFQMIKQQKGFYLALFATSILLSALFVVSFMAYIFRNGVTSKDQETASNYDVIFNLTNTLYNATWESPVWAGRFSFGHVAEMLGEET